MTKAGTISSQRKYSWEEYKKEFFPSEVELEVSKTATPYELGLKLAEKALSDLRSTFGHFDPSS